MSQASAKELAELFEATNPAELTRSITGIQQELIRLAAAKNHALSPDPSRAKIREELRSRGIFVRKAHTHCTWRKITTIIF